MIEVELAEEFYRLVLGDEQGEFVEYGEVAELVTAEGQTYFALVDLDESDEPVIICPVVRCARW